MASERLNGHEVFAVINGDQGFLWRGHASKDSEYNLGKSIFDMYPCSDKKDFVEGEEPEEFWTVLGGKAAYQSIKDLMLSSNDFEPMLFEISNKSGYMWMKQVPAFTQVSLNNNDVYMLDAWNYIYIWVGNKSNKHEHDQAFKKTAQYLEAVKDGRDKSLIQIIEIAPT